MAKYNIHYGKLAAKIQALANTAINEIFSDYSRDIPKFIEYLKKEPITSACAEVKALRASTLLGKYNHPDPNIQTFVRNNLEQLNFTKIIGQLSSFMPLGFAVAEIEFGIENTGKYQRRTVLKSIDTLAHDKVAFRGYKGNILEVTYVDIKKKYIPYEKCIHLTNGLVTDFDEAFGVPEMYKALPYITAKLSLLNNMVIAGKNNATGIWVGKTVDKPIKLYDSTGKPLGKEKRSTVYLAEQLAAIQNNSYIVTDKDVDITSAQIGDGTQFWLGALQYLDKMIMRSFHVPDLVFSEGTNVLSKTASIVGKHLSIMDNNIKAGITQLKSELLLKAIKPIIWSNFGYQEKGWGEFAMERTLDEAQEANYTQNLLNAISYGILSADDPNVQNVVRKTLGMPEVSKAEIEKAKIEKTRQDLMLQQMQMQAQQPPQEQPYP